MGHSKALDVISVLHFKVVSQQHIRMSKPLLRNIICGYPFHLPTAAVLNRSKLLKIWGVSNQIDLISLWKVMKIAVRFPQKQFTATEFYMQHFNSMRCESRMTITSSYPEIGIFL